jgi:hypothetical protein
MKNLLLGGVIAQLVSLGLRQDAKERRVAVRHQVTECKAADENRNAAQNAVEEIECAHSAHADEVKQRPLDAQVGEGLMQALEDPICASILIVLFWHKPLDPRCEW